MSRAKISNVIAGIACLFVVAAGAVSRDDLRYNQVCQKASHNSYHHDQDIQTQVLQHQVQTLEFDAHLRSPGVVSRENAPPGDWFVYHWAKDPFTNCRLLSDCFHQLRAYHDAHPEHQVITIFFDVNELRAPGHARADFYALIRRSFPAGAVLGPPDFMAACPGAKSLQEAVTNPGCGWPRLQDLQGKFMMVVAGGDQLFRAAGYDPLRDLVFLAEYHTEAKNIHRYPDCIFFNFRGPLGFARAVQEAGFVSRAYVLNSPEDYQQARKNGAHLLATDKIDIRKFPWTALSSDPAWPFGIPGE